MPYREEQDALQERLENLQRELAALRAQTRDLAELKLQENRLASDLERTSAQLAQMRGRRSLPMLDSVKVASPCNASWDDMTGDDRVRFCGKCEKNVFNLSAMPREDAEQLLQERLGGELCVRFYQRTDGTILTEDCPVGVKRKRRRRLAFAVAGAGAMVAAGTQAFFSATRCTSQGQVVMGEMEDTTPHVMGSVAPIVETPPTTAKPLPPPAPTGKMLMGKRAAPVRDDEATLGRVAAPTPKPKTTPKPAPKKPPTPAR